MAKLSGFRANVAAINDGEWITVNPEDPFEIKARGFTPAYRDRLNALRREAARKANRGLQPGQLPYTAESLPPTVDDLCQGQAIGEHVFLDVRGLSNEAGIDVTADQFRAMLLDVEQFAFLLTLTLGAAIHVHAERETETAAAVGNSPTASAGT